MVKKCNYVLNFPSLVRGKGEVRKGIDEGGRDERLYEGGDEGPVGLYKSLLNLAMHFMEMAEVWSGECG